MAGLFDRPPPARGLFDGLPDFARMLTNPGGYWGGQAASLLTPPVQGTVEGAINLGRIADKAMSNPTMVGMYGANQQPDFYASGARPGYETGAMDPTAMVPYGMEVAKEMMGGGAVFPAPANSLNMGIRAYHGSPHDFERFEISPRTSHTGEGAQAYGPGGYFAEKKGVAEDYKRRLADPDVKAVADSDVPSEVAQTIDQYAKGFGNAQDARAGILQQLEEEIPATERWIANLKGSPVTESQQTVIDSLPLLRQMRDNLQSGKVQFENRAGRMYEVDIDASPDEFLDWDKSLSEQPAKVQEAIAKAGIYPDATPEDIAALGVSGEHLFKRGVAGQIGGPVLPGGGSARTKNAASDISEALRAAGIKGIRYKDAGSRGVPSNIEREIADVDAEIAKFKAGFQPNDPLASQLMQNLQDQRGRLLADLEKAKTGTSNYVVFSDDIISILKKYGLAGLTAGGAGAAMLGGGTNQAQAAQPPWMTGGRF